MIEYRPGDTLLLPKDKALGPYLWIKEQFGEKVADFLATVEHHNYIHAEFYVGNGYVLAAWMNGVHLVAYPLHVLKNFHVYRPVDRSETFEKCVIQQVKNYFNKPYDFVSLILNGIPELLSLGIEPLERFFEEKIPYDNPEAMICSELVARIYERCGITIEPRPEFVTPDDLAEHLVKIWPNV